MTIANGRRCSTASAYLRPAMRRRNVTVLTGAMATRILLKDGRATGIAYTRGGATHEVLRATRGPACRRRHQHAAAADAVGDRRQRRTRGARHRDEDRSCRQVGKNLQDHVSVILMYRRKQPGPFLRMMRADRIGLDFVKTYLTGKGFSGDVPGGVVAFLKSDASRPLPDVQLLFTAAPLAAWPYMSPFKAPFADGFATRIVAVQPESRGSVKLASADPLAAPLIHQNFLSSPRDWQSLRAGFRVARKLAAQPSMAPFIGAEFFPGSEMRERRRDRRAYPQDLDHRASSSRHLPHGCRRRVGGRSGIAGARRCRTSRSRCFRDAGPRLRQHQCGGYHDRRKGLGPYPQPCRTKHGGLTATAWNATKIIWLKRNLYWLDC